MLHNQLVTWVTATGAQAGSRWSSVQTLQVAPLWCDLGFFPNSRGNKAAANLRLTSYGAAGRAWALDSGLRLEL